jgi:hypothetical protein
MARAVVLTMQAVKLSLKTTAVILVMSEQNPLPWPPLASLTHQFWVAGPQGDRSVSPVDQGTTGDVANVGNLIFPHRAAPPAHPRASALAPI